MMDLNKHDVGKEFSDTISQISLLQISYKDPSLLVRSLPTLIMMI